MRKYIYLILPLIFLLTGCNNNNNDIANNSLNTNQNSTNIEPISVILNNTNNISNTIENSNNNINNNITNNINNNTNTNINNNISINISNNITNTKTSEPKEVELSSFTTTILTSDPHRNNNIQITCNKLNEHIVKPNETFSFTELIGKSTASKGYEEANIISSTGDTIKGLGGGNCQVSSTLYNAVAKIPELEVIERHNHGAEVHYVPLGQDAAVAYGSMDFKFKNNLSSEIKIKAVSNDKEITISIYKINY